MKRKAFIKNAAMFSAGIMLTRDLFARDQSPVYGHNKMRYRMDKDWSKAEKSAYPVKDCHEMVQDAKGRIILLTNETKNNVLIYNKSGKLLESWGHEFPGAHGLTLARENGSEYLFITDTERHQVFKTTLDGKILLTVDVPMDGGLYTDAAKFKPTEVATTFDGDFYVADGYGEQFILHYDGNGKLKNTFGGKGDGEHQLSNAHGICMDTRKKVPTLLITDRTKKCFKRYSLQGEFLEKIHLPGACVCRPVIHGEYLYAAVLRSPDLGKSGTGFVTILDENNKVVSNIGGTEPVYTNGELQPMAQAEKIFIHPHDVCVDDEGSIYVAQWAAGNVYPYKFKRV